MKITKTALAGCFILEPKVFSDERGYFMESFNKLIFEEAIGATINFVQDNQSFSTFGVIRGLHYQTGEHAQAKLVRVLHGSVLDVAVDLRRDSNTFGRHITIELTEDNKKQLFIPRGFAHGFSVLSETATFFYKSDNYYNKNFERGIVYNDRSLSINWQIPEEKVRVSEKDLVLPILKEAIL